MSSEPPTLEGLGAVVQQNAELMAAQSTQQAALAASVSTVEANVAQIGVDLQAALQLLTAATPAPPSPLASGLLHALDDAAGPSAGAHPPAGPGAPGTPATNLVSGQTVLGAAGGGMSAISGNIPSAPATPQTADILVSAALSLLSPECAAAGGRLHRTTALRLTVQQAARMGPRLTWLSLETSTNRSTLRDRNAIVRYDHLTGTATSTLLAAVTRMVTGIPVPKGADANTHRVRVQLLHRAAHTVDAAVREEGLLALLSDAMEMLINDVAAELELLRAGARDASGRWQITEEMMEAADGIRAATLAGGEAQDPTFVRLWKEARKARRTTDKVSGGGK